MIQFSGLRRAAACLLLFAAPSLLPAVDTHVWEQSEQADFTRGTVKKLSIRSDGHVTLAPEFKELDSTTVPYLWAVAQDSKGILYYAGGAPTGASTKIYALSPGGKPRVFAEIPSLEVHALAIDSHDRVYAAVLPDAKIYRIEDGKPKLFFDAKCKYIWALAFDKSGNLFVATGDAGLIYKVSPDGNGAKFFDTEETHARSMVIDAEGNLIVGTEPSGLVLRISPAGKGFVLYQTNKREVTAVAEYKGVIYAAAVGNKTSGGLIPTPSVPVSPASTTSSGPAAATHAIGASPAALPPPVHSLSSSVSGGSEVYRIQKDGSAEKVWSSASDVAYAIAFDGEGRPLVGTGNKGVIYRLDSEQVTTTLLNTPPTQVTSFLEGRQGVVYATTGNVGNLYSIGPGLETAGTLESEVLDATEFAIWGKIHIRSVDHGGSISLETRSGNVNHPESNWTPWTKVDVTELGGQIHSQPARFLQYRLTMTQSSSGESPDLNTIDIAFLPKNVAPKVQQIDMAPFNYRQAPGNQSLERSIQPSGSPTVITLPAVGQKRSSSSIEVNTGGASTLQYSKGFETVRWSANDPNGDQLEFKVELRAAGDPVWRTLKDKLLDHFLAFDSTSFPDGKYKVRIIASDAPSNTPDAVLTSSLESETFIIDNTPPVITIDSADANSIKFSAKDALSWIDRAEYSIDGGDWTLLVPVNMVTDSQSLDYSLTAKPGQMVSVRVYDENDNVAAKAVIAK
jgi:sugar lactone lactonase YvrE